MLVIDGNLEVPLQIAVRRKRCSTKCEEYLWHLATMSLV